MLLQTVSSMSKLLPTVRPLIEDQRQPHYLTIDLRLILFVFSGSVVVLCHQSLEPVISLTWKHFGQQDTLGCPCSQTWCHHPHQNNFTGHKFLLCDNECPVRFSHHGFGPFGGEPGHINFLDGLKKGPWWRHLESYYLGLMNFWLRAVWFMVPKIQTDILLVHRPFTSRLCPQRAFGLHICYSFALDVLCRVIV